MLRKNSIWIASFKESLIEHKHALIKEGLYEGAIKEYTEKLLEELNEKD